MYINDWTDLAHAPRSALFGGRREDTTHDCTRSPLPRPNTEALFTQSNARVLLGHAANGMLRFVALPTQLYPAPTMNREFGLGPGMYHHFDVAMYVGDLAYRLELEDGETVVISAPEEPARGLECETVYAAGWLPVTTARHGDLRLTLTSFAPVAPDPASAPLSPAPLPGPAGAFYVLHIENTGDRPLRGKVVLEVSDMLLGQYEDATPELRALQPPARSYRQRTLILTRPEGAVGVHLHDGAWRLPEQPGATPRLQAEIVLDLAPGAGQTFETHVALAADYAGIMPTIYALHLRDALDWLNLTAAFWDDRLGALSVGDQTSEAAWVRDTYVRNLLDNFNCLQTDADGVLLAHWQGAPSHGYGTVWGIDVEPTAVSVVHICPEIAWATLRFFMNRSRVPRGPLDHSVPILVAPIVIARQWLQVTGDADRFAREPDVMAALRAIVDDLMALKAPGEALFPSRFSSDGGVGRRYDYGTNVKVWYAFDSLAYIARAIGEQDAADAYAALADAIREAIARTMVADGPFGPQITGGTNLDEDPGTFYLPEGVPYYDGEDTSSMLAPIYGMTGLDDPAWVNYHRWARSIWCPAFDPEFGGLRWSPRDFAGGALDGTGFFSRIGGAVTPTEMAEAVRTTHHVVTDAVTGSVFWWPHGLEYKRSLTRCSQGQGAWAWQALKQWFGLEADAGSRTLTVAPRGLLTSVVWQGFRAGPHRFDVAWREPDGDGGETTVTVTNHNDHRWAISVGFRRPGSGATGEVQWQSADIAPGETVTLRHALAPVAADELPTWDEPAMVALETGSDGSDGMLIRRYGQAHLWGHWDLEKQWTPEAMPVALRFLIENGTETDWQEVAVTLRCPEGWQAEGQQPQHWPRPTAMEREATLTLADVPALSRTVAPFWVQWPEGLMPDLLWHENAGVPFHLQPHPGPGITLYVTGTESAVETTFHVAVRITTATGETLHRELDVPVEIRKRD